MVALIKDVRFNEGDQRTNRDSLTSSFAHIKVQFVKQNCNGFSLDPILGVAKAFKRFQHTMVIR